MKFRLRRTLPYVSPLGLVGVWACFNAPVEKPNPKIVQETQVRVEQNVKNKVDLLFMVDDSKSMSPKQNELKLRFPQLIKIIEDFGKTTPADYHIGVVSSDLGAGPVTLPGGTCFPGGKGGKLQAKGAGADVSCVPPTGGVNFIQYNQLNRVGGVATSNLPPGQDLGTTFSCMASVGDGGCGLEHTLEAVYRALHDRPAENHDFLRDEALLVVVFVTDEDDCSGPPDTDLFDQTKVMQYGSFFSYRCSRFGVMDGQGNLLPYADSGGTISGATSATAAKGAKLIEIQKYISFFTKPAAQGGVKVNPEDVILVGITGPSSPVSTLLANPNPVPPGPYTQCGAIGAGCDVVLQHSCIAPTNTQFFGDPAVRINEVINAAANKQLTSICDTSYQSALEGLGQKIVSAIGAGCITSPFEDPNNPDCVVEDVTKKPDGTTTVSPLPNCARNGAAVPCWQLEAKALDKCAPVCASNGAAGQHFGINISRGPAGPPPNTTARVACATLAVPKDPVSGQLPTCGNPL